jgi:3-oxoacyl-[acyl-carrier-protein] synthase II
MLQPVSITAVSALSCLGMTLPEHMERMNAGQHGLRPLLTLGNDFSQWSELPAGWIEPRSTLAGNRYGPATNLALLAATTALRHAALAPGALRESWLYVGTSRGNAAGWLAPWPGRRGHRKMSASNTSHSEMAAAISIAHGIRGPNHVISNGCASGLDVLGLAWMAVAAGFAPRAIAVSADLPLVPILLNSYGQTGLLSRNGVNDPYSPQTTGFLPGEAGAAVVLEPASQASSRALCHVKGYWANADAYDPLGLPPDGSGIAELLLQARGDLGSTPVSAVCVHASGTPSHGQAELRALHRVFSGSRNPIALSLLKPFTGHSIGASGALDTAILAHYLQKGLLPPNLPRLAGAGGPFLLPEKPMPLPDGVVLKMSVGMGGRNAIIALNRA